MIVLHYSVMELSKLARRVHQAPTTPGVYTWKSATGTPLYIGKAANLRSRLSSYLKTTHPRTRAMIARAERLAWEETPTDIDALILEAQRIKKYNPQYNIDWRDDKRYFYVGFTREDFPRIFLTHQPETGNSKLGTSYIGPFTEGEPLKATLRTLRNLFPYCTCKQLHNLRCLNAHIDKCPGYCCLKPESFQLPVDSSRYRKLRTENRKLYLRNIRAIKDLLTGKRNTVIRRFAKTNTEVAMKLFRVFQNAQVNARLRQGFGGQARNDVPHRVEGYDIAHMQGTNVVGAMAVFTDGRADTSEYRLFNIKETNGDVPMLREMLERRMKHIHPANGGASWPLPDLVVIDGGKAQLNIAKAIFNESKVKSKKSKEIPIIAVRKDEHHRAEYLLTSDSAIPQKLADVPRPLRNLAIHVDAEAHRFAIARYRRQHRSSMK